MAAAAGADDHLHAGGELDVHGAPSVQAGGGIAIRKFLLLHVSHQEQKRRLLQRLDRPAKHWKFVVADAKERTHREDCPKASEDMIRETSTPYAPYVVAADHTWFTRAVGAAAVEDALREMKLECPRVWPAQKQQLESARTILEDIQSNDRTRRPPRSIDGPRATAGGRSRPSASCRRRGGSG